MSTTLIKNATIAGANNLRSGSVVISGDTIVEIIAPDAHPSLQPDSIIDASDCILMPGIIDDHVHFREPGLTHKATIASESRAAAAGGVTTIFDMPNCIPQTTTLQALRNKCDIAAENCLVNYSFYLGATHDNLSQIERIDPSSTCGVKLFMGSSTGGMLVEGSDHIYNIFKASPVLVAAHCEETSIINRNMERYTISCGCEPPVEYHPLIRSEEACYASSSRAAELAAKAGAHLHLLHITTARELELLDRRDLREKSLTAEVCPAHIFFTDQDYATLGTRIKCNPAVKGLNDRNALRDALKSGLIDVVGTDHAPHLLSEKQGGCKSAASGMPVLPYSLPVMMELADSGVISICDIVRTMCQNPALLFGIRRRGIIREGYKADLTLIRKDSYTVQDSSVPGKCGWSPFNGHTFNWRVTHTWVNGNNVYRDGIFNDKEKGELVLFDR